MSSLIPYSCFLWTRPTFFLKQYLGKVIFKSFKPIPLRKDQEDVAVIFLLPPDPLRVNLLGCGNDTLECMEKHMKSNPQSKKIGMCTSPQI